MSIPDSQSIPHDPSPLNVVHKHSGILLCHKKEWNGANCDNTDGIGDFNNEWHKSDGENQTSDDIAYMWIRKWYKGTNLQNKK